MAAGTLCRIMGNYVRPRRKAHRLHDLHGVGAPDGVPFSECPVIRARPPTMMRNHVLETLDVPRVAIANLPNTRRLGNPNSYHHYYEYRTLQTASARERTRTSSGDRTPRSGSARFGWSRSRRSY